MFAGRSPELAFSVGIIYGICLAAVVGYAAFRRWRRRSEHQCACPSLGFTRVYDIRLDVPQGAETTTAELALLVAPAFETLRANAPEGLGSLPPGRYSLELELDATFHVVPPSPTS
jgi:hypothetical protein